MKSFLLILLFILVVPRFGLAAPAVYAGGVAGIADLVDPAHSAKFRAAGGGLYLHNSGWGRLDDKQKAQVLQTFHGAPVMLELGFGVGAHARAWADLCKSHYLALGIKPDLIAANAFASNNHPTAAQWSDYSKALRDVGVPASTHILPTFEYQNFRSNLATLAQNQVSAVPNFQAILQSAGGIVLDTPSGYFFGREQAYRDWVVDAIHWTQAHHQLCVVIVSPHSSGIKWAADAERFVGYLKDHQAMPTAFACENYSGAAPADYPNQVGSEDEPNTALGVAWLLAHQILPALAH